MLLFIKYTIIGLIIQGQVLDMTMIQPGSTNNLDSVSLILIWRCVKIYYPAHVLLALNAIESISK